MSTLRKRSGAELREASSSGTVIVDGTADDVRTHLESVFGSSAFRLVGTEIELELPLVGKDKRPRSSGETVMVKVKAPASWSAQAPEGGSWWHVVPDGASTTLCTIPLATWTTAVRRDDDHVVSCPWCRVRLIAIEIAAPPGAKPIESTDRPFEVPAIVRDGIAAGMTPDQICARNGKKRSIYLAAILEEAWTKGELASLDPTAANVVLLRDKDGYRWERIAVRIFGDPRRMREAKDLYDEAKGKEGASQVYRSRSPLPEDERLARLAAMPVSFVADA